MKMPAIDDGEGVKLPPKEKPSDLKLEQFLNM
jgi:hypothetical protein